MGAARRAGHRATIRPAADGTDSVEVITVQLAALRIEARRSYTVELRLVDGGPAARFLQRVKQFVEQPYLWLV